MIIMTLSKTRTRLLHLSSIPKAYDSTSAYHRYLMDLDIGSNPASTSFKLGQNKILALTRRPECICYGHSTLLLIRVSIRIGHRDLGTTVSAATSGRPWRKHLLAASNRWRKAKGFASNVVKEGGWSLLAS